MRLERAAADCDIARIARDLDTDVAIPREVARRVHRPVHDDLEQGPLARRVDAVGDPVEELNEFEPAVHAPLDPPHGPADAYGIQGAAVAGGIHPVGDQARGLQCGGQRVPEFVGEGCGHRAEVGDPVVGLVGSVGSAHCASPPPSEAMACSKISTRSRIFTGFIR